MQILVQLYYLMFLLVIVKGSDRYVEIIDSIARLPKRRWGEGSLEREVQKRIQEEGLPEMTGPTIRRQLRKSAEKQGIEKSGSPANDRLMKPKEILVSRPIAASGSSRRPFEIIDSLAILPKRKRGEGCVAKDAQRIQDVMLEPKVLRENGEILPDGSSLDDKTTDLFIKSGSRLDDGSIAWPSERARRFAKAYFP